MQRSVVGNNNDESFFSNNFSKGIWRSFKEKIVMKLTKNSSPKGPLLTIINSTQTEPISQRKPPASGLSPHLMNSILIHGPHIYKLCYPPSMCMENIYAQYSNPRDTSIQGIHHMNSNNGSSNNIHTDSYMSISSEHTFLRSNGEFLSSQFNFALYQEENNATSLSINQLSNDGDFNNHSNENNDPLYPLSSNHYNSVKEILRPHSSPCMSGWKTMIKNYSGATDVFFRSKEDGLNCVFTLLSNLPIFYTTTESFSYFEVEILDLPSTSVLSIGLATDEYPTCRLPGWSPWSIGLQTDDGRIYYNDGFNVGLCMDYLKSPVRTGDVVGCGYDHVAGSIFWTLKRHGNDLMERHMNAISGKYRNYHIAVGCYGKKGAKVSINFGATTFHFEDANMGLNAPKIQGIFDTSSMSEKILDYYHHSKKKGWVRILKVLAQRNGDGVPYGEALNYATTPHDNLTSYRRNKRYPLSINTHHHTESSGTIGKRYFIVSPRKFPNLLMKSLSFPNFRRFSKTNTLESDIRNTPPPSFIEAIRDTSTTINSSISSSPPEYEQEPDYIS